MEQEGGITRPPSAYETAVEGDSSVSILDCAIRIAKPSEKENSDVRELLEPLSSGKKGNHDGGRHRTYLEKKGSWGVAKAIEEAEAGSLLL